MSTLINTRRALLALALVALSGSDGRCGGGGPTAPVDRGDPQHLIVQAHVIGFTGVACLPLVRVRVGSVENHLFRTHGSENMSRRG